MRLLKTRSAVRASLKASVATTVIALTTLSNVAIADDEERGIEEIVVTAQKRDQSSQDVGIAVAAISAKTMLEQGITNGADLAKAIPNLSLQNIGGGGLPVVIVRGIGLQNFRINDSPTTSFYVDEIYQTSIASVEFSMYDMSRVEVLKGPQGGLYGRNTIGGAVQVISKAPEVGEDANGFISAGYGSYDRVSVEGGASYPLSDTMAVRLSGRYEKSGDQYTRSVVDGFNHGEIDKLAGRFQLRLTPSDSVDILFKVHGGKDHSETSLLRTVGLYQNYGGAGGFGAPNVSLALIYGLFGQPGMLCDSITSGNGSDPSSCATLNGQTPESLGLTTGDEGRYDSAGVSMLPAIMSDWFGASAVANFDINDDFTLTSITAYDKIDYNRTIDADATKAEFQDIEYSSKIKSYQQELRLAYDSNEKTNWLLGVNYAEDELTENTVLYGADGVLPLFFGGATWSPQDYVQKTKAFAAFGHGEWNVSDTVSLISELRYTNAKKTFAGGQQLGFADGTTAPFFTVADEISFNALSGKVGINWQPNDDMLVYANASRGFKTGGFFGGFATNPDELTPFDKETINAYEIGFKSDLADKTMRLNASIFYYDRQDVQMNAADPDPDAVVHIAHLSNIGDIKAYGAEVDLTWLATDYLTIQASAGMTNSEIDKSNFNFNGVLPLSGGGSAEGRNTPNYSKFSSNVIARYERPVSDALFGHFQAEYNYRSSKDLSLITNPTMETPLFHEPGYGLLNLRAGITPQEGGWSLTASVDNVTESIYRVEARGDGLYGVRELYGAPRTWRLNVSYDF